MQRVVPSTYARPGLTLTLAGTDGKAMGFVLRSDPSFFEPFFGAAAAELRREAATGGP